jgi:hypothetical protein
MTDWITAIASAVAVLAVIVGAFLALRQIGEGQKTRHAELLLDLSRRWDEPLLKGARLGMVSRTQDEILKLVEVAYSEPQASRDEFYELQPLPNFLEALAIIERRAGGIELELVNELWGSAILTTWNYWRPAVKFMRERQEDETIYANFEGLRDRVMELRAT